MTTALEALVTDHPAVLIDAVAAGGPAGKRVFQAMMGMRKIDVAAIGAARRG
jgi:hypothetical protein